MPNVMPLRRLADGNNRRNEQGCRTRLTQSAASVLHLDYSRREGEWIVGRFGGRENLEAIGVIKESNEIVTGTTPRSCWSHHRRGQQQAPGCQYPHLCSGP